MKNFLCALLAIATLALVGCTPKNPPSGYPEDAAPAPPAFDPLPPQIAQPELPQRPVTPPSARSLWNEGTGRYKQEAVLTTVYFGFDKYNVAQPERAKLQAVLDKAKTTRIVVAGYTDHYGTDQYNMALSDKRAQSVKNYLLKLGVPEENIDVQGYGKQFAKPAGTKAQVADDRRADVVDLNHGAQ